MKKLLRLIVLYGTIFPFTANALGGKEIKVTVKQKKLNKQTIQNNTTMSVLSGEDVGVISILTPTSVNCSNFISPDITIKNFSNTIITSVKINYQIDNGAILSYDWTGTLQGNTSTDVNGLPLSNLSEGTHTIRVFTSSPNGSADVQPNNDELISNFLISGAPSPQLLSQDFESTSSWPYSNYLVLNPDKDKTWSIANVGYTGTKSITINGFNYSKNAERDEFVIPAVDFMTVTGKPELSFWLAYQSKNNPATLTKTDTLSVLASIDCGLSWKSIYMKTGANLTTTSPAFSSTSFTPTNADWRKEIIDLSTFINQYGLYLKFVHSNYFENNLYIDNINITASKTPSDIGLTKLISPIGIQCSNVLTPKINLKNFDTKALSSATITYTIDGGAAITTQWNGYLDAGKEVLVTLNPSTAVTSGLHTVSIVVSNPNGGSDSNNNNDKITGTFFMAGPVGNLPFNEGFETTTAWPYNNYYLNNSDNAITWQTSKIAHSGATSLYINNYNYTQKGESDEFILPAITLSNNTKSTKLNFWLAYQSKNNLSVININDTLEVFISTDCGANWKKIYQKTGSSLVTASTPFSSSAFVPASNDWRQENIDLSALNGSQQLYIKFKNTTSNGNNLYLDDINIDVINSGPADAGISNISTPADIICTSTFTPTVTLKNFSNAVVLNDVKILFNIDNQTNTSFSWTGNLAPGATTVVSLTPLTVSNSGNHKLIVSTSNPNGALDGQTNNDQLVKNFNIAAAAQNTFTLEGFESGATWPYTNYALINADGDKTWTLGNIGYSGSKSIYIQNFSYSAKGAIDEFVLPPYNLSGISGTAQLSFWHAYQAKTDPNANGKTDTLEIYASIDCGVNWKRLFKNSGKTLITATNTFSATEFTPKATEWKQNTIDLAPYIGSPSVFIKFRNINNNENNLYIDNINILTTVGIEKKILQEEVIVYPNPSSHLFHVSIEKGGVNTATINVYNVLGEKIHTQTLAPGVFKTTIDLEGKMSGVYYLETQIDGKIETKKILLSQ